MKNMTKRAENALLSAGYIKGLNPAIEALVSFAAQNPGLEYGNYGDPVSYRAESRSINQDWQRFKGALTIAAREGVTDKEVIEVAPRAAFSGRLTWHSKQHHDHKTGQYMGRWDYCAGQYFPTEYRKAATTVLEYATREVRRKREPAIRPIGLIRTIAELKQLNEQNGGCWFAPAEMRFFGTRIESGILHNRYFITSEQREENTPRRFSVRTFDEEGNVDTVGVFHSHDTKEDALEALQTHLETEQVAA